MFSKLDKRGLLNLIVHVKEPAHVSSKSKSLLCLLNYQFSIMKLSKI